MKRRWILIVAGLTGVVSIMGTKAPVNRFITGSQLRKTTILDTVPNKKRDTTSYPRKDTTMPR